MTTPEQAMEAIHRRFGRHEGHRALHAKGIICAGTFTATPPAAKLTRAAHMSGAPVPAIARFSNGSGNPKVPDYVPDVRGLAVSFELPDGSRTDISAQTAPHFPFKDERGFVGLLEAAKPSPTVLYKLPVAIARNPRLAFALPRLALTLPANLKSLSSPPASFASRSYLGIHAFKWLNGDGGERWVRYTWRPTIDEPDPARGEAKERGRDYLFDDLRERFESGGVRMDLEIQIAGPDDNPHDPSSEWPDERERVTVGTLEVNAVDTTPDDAIVFDPMRLTDGIEASDDPVLHFRPAVYSLSHAERTGS
jgi:catalase